MEKINFYERFSFSCISCLMTFFVLSFLCGHTYKEVIIPIAVLLIIFFSIYRFPGLWKYILSKNITEKTYKNSSSGKNGKNGSLGLIICLFIFFIFLNIWDPNKYLPATLISLLLGFIIFIKPSIYFKIEKFLSNMEHRLKD